MTASGADRLSAERDRPGEIPPARPRRRYLPRHRDRGAVERLERIPGVTPTSSSTDWSSPDESIVRGLAGDRRGPRRLRASGAERGASSPPSSRAPTASIAASPSVVASTPVRRVTLAGSHVTDPASPVRSARPADATIRANCDSSISACRRAGRGGLNSEVSVDRARSGSAHLDEHHAAAAASATRGPTTGRRHGWRRS